MPASSAIDLPIQRASDFFPAHPVPAFGQPQIGVAIAAGLDKIKKFTIRDQARRQQKWRDIVKVARQFIVETKSVAPDCGLETDADQAAVKSDPGWLRRDRSQRQRQRRSEIGRQQRVLRQQVLDIGQHQFLVLLLVLQTQFEQIGQLRARSRTGIGLQQTDHARIDILPVGAHLKHAGPGQQAALGARMARADAVVIRIEQHPKSAMKGDELRLQRFQHEGFKKPGRVRQMPFQRTGVRHRLRAAILVGQRGHQQQRVLAHAFVAGERIKNAHASPHTIDRHRSILALA